MSPVISLFFLKHLTMSLWRSSNESDLKIRDPPPLAGWGPGIKGMHHHAGLVRKPWTGIILHLLCFSPVLIYAHLITFLLSAGTYARWLCLAIWSVTAKLAQIYFFSHSCERLTGDFSNCSIRVLFFINRNCVQVSNMANALWLLSVTPDSSESLLSHSQLLLSNPKVPWSQGSTVIPG